MAVTVPRQVAHPTHLQEDHHHTTTITTITKAGMGPLHPAEHPQFLPDQEEARRQSLPEIRTARRPYLPETRILRDRLKGSITMGHPQGRMHLRLALQVDINL